MTNKTNISGVTKGFQAFRRKTKYMINITECIKLIMKENQKYFCCKYYRKVGCGIFIFYKTWCYFYHHFFYLEPTDRMLIVFQNQPQLNLD